MSSSLSLRLRAVLVALSLVVLAVACAGKPAKPDMTPDESREVFIAETIAVIRAVLPDTDPRVAVREMNRPCGGPAGTDYSSVAAGISAHGEDPDDAMDPDNVFRNVVEVLKQRGWRIKYSDSRIAGAEREGVGDISAVLAESPLGIDIIGTTECVRNPAFAQAPT
ncbi:hypothetical protein [Sphaerimonospora thailandensis]|uniref:LppA-like lipoprotein n=1 Tax=Sphaerimonospora thailandensis TaxID=795644 RepID=A0A8J3RBB0_9ACTN|nr:hypothetical protein [Sphaerimonospora thailandensis]GIH72926.1 hypothetical protein Mth01_51790 [Sphaerimonospora thailandensis]